MHAVECPFEDLLGTVCKKWPLLLIATLGKKGERKFGELSSDLQGISPRSLSRVLSELCSLGLISRKEYRGVPPRVGYELTAKGRELTDAVRPLLEWAAELRPDEECPILSTIRG